MTDNEILKELLLLEQSLFKHEKCIDSLYLNEILHDDFMEFGTSGKIYNKETTISLLMSVTEDRALLIHYPQLKKLSNGKWLLHYISENKDTGTYSNRTSIWIYGEGYQLYFHQGTAADSAVAY